MFRGDSGAQDGDLSPVGASFIARLESVVGSVAIRRASTFITRARVEDVIYQGDRIETGIDGAARISLADGTTLQLDAALKWCWRNPPALQNELLTQCCSASSAARFALLLDR